MEPPDPASETVRQETANVFEIRHGRQPRTTAEVAARVGRETDTVRPQLDHLVDEGYLDCRALPDGTTVWWRVDPTGHRGDTGDRRAAGVPGHGDPAEFKSFVDAVRDYAIFTLDPEGVVRSWNRGAERIKGYTADEIVGGHVSVFYTDEAVEAGVPAQNLARAARDGRLEDEGWRVRADGTKFWANVVITAIRDDDGDLIGFTKVTRDLTDRAEFEGDLRRERELTDQLKRYETIVETVSDGVYVVDGDGNFTMVNEAYASMVGYDREELVGEHVSMVVDDDVSERARRVVREHEETQGEMPTIEAEVRRKDGERVPAEANFSMLPEGDDTWHRVGVVRDVSGRRERERRLEESERRYRTLVEHFPGGAVGLFDQNLEYTAMGGQLLEEVGIGPESRVGERVSNLYPPELVDEVEPYFEGALRGEPSEFEVEYHGRYLSGTTLPVRDSSGEIFAGMLLVEDVTEYREYERHLEARARQQETVADLGQLALETEDLDELMHEGSRQVAAVLECDYAKVLDLDDEERELLLREGVGWEPEIVGQATVSADAESQAGYTLRSATPVVVEDLDAETRFAGPALLDGHDVRSGISTIIGSVEQPWGVLGTHNTERRSFTDEDVHFVKSVANVLAEAIERHRYQRELEQLVADLEESNERLEQFAYAASHDLQEPLRMVSSYLQLLDRRYGETFDEDGQEFLEFAVDGAERMRDMIDGLLEYSRVDTRGSPFEPVDLDVLVEDVTEDLAMRIEETGARISVGSLPTVEGDPSQLRQLVQNLLDNAIEYSGEAPPVVEVSGERVGDRVRLSVRDEGIGIEPEDQERVFDVFQRLHTQEEHAGTGIGLALCERIVERHDGDVEIESTPGEGTTVTVTLPARGEDGE